MNDRELLELSAKAAGLRMMFYSLGSPRIASDGCVMGYRWNPLTDDGDALQLASSLRLHIKPGKHVGDGCTVETQRPGIASCTTFYDDKAQQMRQAIVRAAAEIGKAMP